MQEINLIVGEQDKDKRIDVYLHEKLSVELEFGQPITISREIIKKLILSGDITVNGNKTNPHQKIKPGDIIVGVYRDAPVIGIIPQNIPLDIVYEDDDLIVINKQAGLVVHPAPGNWDNTLVNGLVFLGKQLSTVDPTRPGIVHRLDQETSGLMLIAKNNQAHYFFVKQFSRHLISRQYIAVVYGEIQFDEGRIDSSIGKHPKDFRRMTTGISRDEKNALTYYKTLKRTKNWSFLELIPQTGRTHQLRVHLASIGHPILGDTKYGKNVGANGSLPLSSRMFLHAKSIKFPHPRTKEIMEFKSDLPIEFKNFLNDK
ncbi:MAG: RluA family pseudouridine synthase [Candidatus Omnitrophota bacterium]